MKGLNRKKGLVKSVFITSLTIFLVIFGILFGESIAVKADGLWTFMGSNYVSHTGNYGSPLKSYLTESPDGGLMRVQAGTNIDGYLIEYYSMDYKLQSQMLVSTELPIFGQFYETDDNYFIISGQNNPDSSADVECYRITKYDKEWNRICSTGLYDCNTRYPFDAGSCRAVSYGDYLLIRTCHGMYGGHQANVTIQYDIANNKITDSYTAVGHHDGGYFSHSFNQFVCVENGKLVGCDQWEGSSGRAVEICKYSKDLSTGKFSTTPYTGVTNISALTFPASSGSSSNYTGTFIGGFEMSSSSYLVSGNSNVISATNDVLPSSSVCRNIFVSVVNRSTSEVSVKWLTNYAENDDQPSDARLVKINDNQFFVIWSQNKTTYYQKIDGSGNKIGNQYSFEGAQLTDCDPVLIDNKIIWYYWNNYELHFYEIPVNNLSSPSDHQLGANVTSVEITSDFESGKTYYVGDEIQLQAKVLPENASNKELQWKSSNEEILTVDENGLAKIVGAGFAYVTVRSTDGSNKRAQTEYSYSRFRLTRLEFNSRNISIDVGETADFYLIAEPEKGSSYYYGEAYSSESGVITVDKDNKTVTGNKPGYAYYMAKAQDDTGFSDYCYIYVYGSQEAPTSLSMSSVTPNKIVLSSVSGQEYSMDGVNWQTSATFTGLEPNTEYDFYTRKRAKSYYHESDAYGPVKFKTEKQPITKLTVSPTNYDIKEEESFEIEETILPENATDKIINWTSSNPELAKVERTADGKVVVTGLKYGKAVEIKGIANDGSGKTATVTVNVNEKEHAWDEGTVTQQPTCTKTGEKKYKCTVCGNEETRIIDMLPHKEVVDAYKAPGCETTGLTEGKHCSVCKTVLVAQEEIPATGHNSIVDPAVAPTCTTNGLTEGSHCSNCGKVFTAQEVDPLLGHDYTEWTDVYGDQTLFTRTCNRCDLLEAEEHRYDDGVVTTKPSCECTGVMTFTCQDCGREKTSIIQPTGHTLVVDPAVAPKCEKTGLTEGSHCANCDTVFTAQEVIPSLGHDWDEGVVSEEPEGCGKDGIMTYTCQREGCGETKNEKITAEPHEFEYHKAISATLTSPGTREFYICKKCERMFTDEDAQEELFVEDLPTYLFDNDGVVKYNGTWYYVKNRLFDKSYTGFGTNKNGVWYVKNGIVDFKITGVYKGTINGKTGWYYVKDSKYNSGYTGFANNSNGTWYVKKGIVDFKVTGVYKGTINGKTDWYYVKDSKYISSFTGIASNQNGSWYVKNGKVNFSYSGTVKFNKKTYTIKAGKVTAVK